MTDNKECILVLGKTGTGKSSIISKMTMDNTVKISDGSESCTMNVKVFKVCKFQQQKYHTLYTHKNYVGLFSQTEINSQTSPCFLKLLLFSAHKRKKIKMKIVWVFPNKIGEKVWVFSNKIFKNVWVFPNKIFEKVWVFPNKIFEKVWFFSNKIFKTVSVFSNKCNFSFLINSIYFE